MTRTSDRSGVRGVTVSLFMALFAGQVALIALSPVLADAASDLHVSTAAAGQLRTITGLAAGVTAVGFGAVGARVGLWGQLLAASALLALGSLASAAAPTFAAAGARATARRRRRGGADNGGNARRRRVGVARQAGPRPLLGAPRAARGLDRRHAADRARRRGELAPRACAPARRRGRRGDPRRLARREPSGRVAAGQLPRSARRPHPRALARIRTVRKRGLGGHARLRGSAVRGVVRDLHRAHGLPARRPGDRVRGRKPRLPAPRPARAATDPRPARARALRYRRPLRPRALGRRDEHRPALDRCVRGGREDAGRERVRAWRFHPTCGRR